MEKEVTKKWWQGMIKVGVLSIILSPLVLGLFGLLGIGFICAALVMPFKFGFVDMTRIIKGKEKPSKFNPLAIIKDLIPNGKPDITRDYLSEIKEK